MKEIVLYAHGGSSNHGCEAIVRGTVKIIDSDYIQVLSLKIAEDEANDLKSVVEVIDGTPYFEKKVKFFLARLYNKIFKNNKYILECIYENYFPNGQKNIYISLGGDNYCYGTPVWLLVLNKNANKSGSRTVLWGCSIEESLFADKRAVADLKRYALIIARESITYNSLCKAGITKNTKIYPDPAFILDTFNLKSPKGFQENNTIGINVSPRVIENEDILGATISNYTTLLQHIIDSTNMQIALIPHVVKENDDDRIPITVLYNKFKESGRVVMINDYNCMELKGFISRCRMFIGARTHATIAAYSTCVPTLVVGYSVKAKGIAKDIFGTYENYVIPVQGLENKDDLIKAFEWLKKNEVSIKTHLEKFMPSYIEKAWQAGEEVKKLLKG
jgi:colanic acid/amylovoran biosynthesis protein